jgi:hypothetical protein
MSRRASSLGALPPMMPVEIPPITSITNSTRTSGIATMARKSFFIGGSIPATSGGTPWASQDLRGGFAGAGVRASDSLDTGATGETSRLPGPAVIL